MKTFYITKTGNKEFAFHEALHSAKWTEVTSWKRADLCLFDSDVPEMRQHRIDEALKNGSKVVLYPHAAHPPYWYDCRGFPPHPGVHLLLYSAPAHDYFLRTVGDTRPRQEIGWSYCEFEKFRPKQKLETILFAPKHANATGFLAAIDQNNNRSAFYALLNFCRKWKVKLFVRYLGNLSDCNVPKEEDVHYFKGAADLSTLQLDQADLVVAKETFLYLAAARSKPALGFGEAVAPHYGYDPDAMTFAGNWIEYALPMMYPYDLLTLDNDQMYGIFYELLREEQPWLTNWKADHLGFPFQPKRFLELMESLVGK